MPEVSNDSGQGLEQSRDGDLPWSERLVAKASSAIARAEARAREESEKSDAELARKAEAEKKEREEALARAELQGLELGKKLEGVISAALETAAEKGRVRVEIEFPELVSLDDRRWLRSVSYVSFWGLTPTGERALTAIEKRIVPFLRRNKLVGLLIRNVQPIESYRYDSESTCSDGPSGSFVVDDVDRWYTLFVAVKGTEALENRIAAVKKSAKEGTQGSSDLGKPSQLPQFWRPWEIRSEKDGRPIFDPDHLRVGAFVYEKAPDWNRTYTLDSQWAPEVTARARSFGCQQRN